MNNGKTGHGAGRPRTVREYRYYDGERLCSVITADFCAHTVAVKNYTDSMVDTAFGVNDPPTWDDFTDFLESRCVPRTRHGLQYYLDALGLCEYDPAEIIEKTRGRMAEDQKWLEIV